METGLGVPGQCFLEEADSILRYPCADFLCGSAGNKKRSRNPGSAVLFIYQPKGSAVYSESVSVMPPKNWEGL